MDHYDLIVIGAGPAGEKGAAQAAYFGKRVALVEREPHPGGAGINTGTVPSKTLRETALYFSGLGQRGLYGVETKLRLERVRAFAHRLRELSGYDLEPFKPLFGENLFTRESGAVAAQFHDPQAIEPYSSDLVAAPRRIVLGKKSGVDSIRIKAQELGLDLSEDDERRLLAAVKERGTEKRGLVTDEEFLELARG